MALMALGVVATGVALPPDEPGTVKPLLVATPSTTG